MISFLRTIGYKLRTQPVLGRWALRAIPDISITRRIGVIGPFRIRLRRNRSLWLREPLESERVPFGLLRQLVKPGDTVFDCGANIGLYERYLIQSLQAARVVAFEPDPENLALLRQNLALANIETQVTIVPVALSYEDGGALFQTDDLSSASGTLDRVTEGQAAEGRRRYGLKARAIEVQSLRLDTAIDSLRLPTPDVIKIDVEGAEDLLLRGASRTLSVGPRLLIELHGANHAHKILPLLERHRYVCAGSVGAHIHASRFSRVDSSLLPKINELYDLHFIAATKDPGALPIAPTLTEPERP